MTIRYRPAEDDGKEERVPVDVANQEGKPQAQAKEAQAKPKA